MDRLWKSLYCFMHLLLYFYCPSFGTVRFSFHCKQTQAANTVSHTHTHTRSTTFDPSLSTFYLSFHYWGGARMLSSFYEFGSSSNIINRIPSLWYFSSSITLFSLPMFFSVPSVLPIVPWGTCYKALSAVLGVMCYYIIILWFDNVILILLKCSCYFYKPPF